VSLNKVFGKITTRVAAVDAIINALTDPNRKYIDQRLNQAIYYSDYIARNMLRHSEDLDTAQTAAIKYLIISYGILVKEYDDHISRIREGVDAAFTQYYNDIVSKLKWAITLTWNEIQESETYVLGQIAATKDVILNKVTADLAQLDTKLTVMIDAVKLELDAKDDSLLTKILDAAAEVYDYVTSQVSAMMNTVSTWLDELWDYVGSIMTWLTDKFNEFYIQIVDWVSETLTSIRARITREVNTLISLIDSAYRRAESLVNTAKAWLVSEINRLGETLRGLLNAAIVEVTNLLDTLALLTDWRFAFFNLSLSFPELGFLQVLNRDDETFKRFKPYWQALFARVMEED